MRITIRSGSTYGSDAEPLGLPMNARQRRKYEATLADIRERAEDAQATADTISNLKAYTELERRRYSTRKEQTMPKDPSIEEVREVIDGLEQHYSMARNEYPAEVIRAVINQIKKAAAPKPVGAFALIQKSVESHLHKRITKDWNDSDDVSVSAWKISMDLDE